VTKEAGAVQFHSRTPVAVRERVDNIANRDSRDDIGNAILLSIHSFIHSRTIACPMNPTFLQLIHCRFRVTARGMLFAACVCTAMLTLIKATAAETRPNIVLVLVDDLRWDDVGFGGHPFSKTPNMDRVAREGVKFSNAFATTPLCSPSRATILTGFYTHTHGITDNTDRSPASHRLVTFPLLLQRAGYDTAFIGKWHMGNDDTPRPGFSFWAALQGQGSSFDATLNVNGKVAQTSGYVTDVLTERALDFLRQPRAKPFLLYMSHKALHPEAVQRADGSISDPTASNFIPAGRHATLYSDQSVPRRPNALGGPRGKPALERKLPGIPPLNRDTGSSDKTILDRLRMLASVDESTGALIKALEASGELDRTVFVITSDHGYFYGEHGLSVERRLAYEEAIRIPLAVRYPPLIKERSATRDQMVLTIDLAPTFLELGGAPAPENLHGKSLVSLLGNEGRGIRDSFLIEYYSDTVFPRVHNMGYQAVRTDSWKYIHYLHLPGMDELYDLKQDPYEMNNLAAGDRANNQLAVMKGELSRLLEATTAPKR
jgi:N-acetylglucosamine-6-sulfatase